MKTPDDPHPQMSEQLRSVLAELPDIRYPMSDPILPPPKDMEESIAQERIALDIRYAQPVSRTPKLTVIDGGKSAGDDHAED